ncbi:MAG: 4-hydroxy-tetrahydrodipicolinate synthase [Lachnospiraceae bacterium]|nr:4-hydroxy-tetrahydrodipicolinate synthase [Lachnospiraceae bacterium]
MAIFTGAGVAIVTPFKKDGSVDFDKFGELIDYQIENKTDAIIVAGTTGEASTLSHEEHIEVVKYCVQKVNKRVPVVAGTGSNSTETAIYLSTEAYKAGADGLLLVSPYYNKATQKGLKVHFGEVAKKVDLPIILYNIPGRTGVKIMPQTIAELVNEYDNIIATKDACSDLSHTLSTVAACDGKIDIYSGNDDQITAMMSLGAKGVISVLSMVAPADTHEICASYLRGDVKKSLELQVKYHDLIKALFCEVNPIPVKAALNLMGFEVGGLRLPLTDLESDHVELMRKELAKVGII